MFRKLVLCKPITKIIQLHNCRGNETLFFFCNGLEGKRKHTENSVLRKNNPNLPKMLCNLVVRFFEKKKNSICLKPLKKYLHGEIIPLKFILKNYLKNTGLYHH